MTSLSPTGSVLLFGGADGKIFFEDIFLLEPASYANSSSRSSGEVARSSRQDDEETPGHAAIDVQWKRLVVSHGTAFNGQSPRSPMFSSAPTSNTSPSAIGSGIERRPPAFIHPGGGRDYHSMHYVESFKDEERTRGMAFDTPTLRVEELRVRQPMLEAQWEARRVDHSSMWKPRARHAHSSVVVGGDQVFVFGGKDATSTTFFNDIFYYDAPLNQWVKPTVNPTGQLPQPRAFAGLTASHDGKTLFLFGGTDGKQEFGSLFLYDVMHSRWDSLANATLGDRPTCRINHSLTFAAPNHLVLFGGRRRAVRQNELFIYNVNSRTWRLVHGEWSRGSRRRSQTDDYAPVGRTAHATVLFHSEPAEPNAVQKLLIFGGYAGAHQWLDDLYLLSLPQTVLMQAPTTSRSSSQSIAATQTQQQEPAVSSGVANPRVGASSSGALKKNKRRRLADDSQESSNSNSNSSNGSGELTNAQVGIQTMLLQLLQHQPRMEDALARITSMLTREQTARQQQSLNQETVMRVHSEEQSKRLEAANRRNEALEGQLARAEAERASLHEKLMARETELYMHKHSLEAAIPPLSERVQAIEASHIQQLNVSRVIESKISAVHDFMDELRNAGGEGTEADDSPQRHLGRLDDSVASQPTPSPPKPLLYPQRVVLALEEKIRVMQSEKNAREAQVREH
ncbi:uncharacterized protein PITG_05908 [Phytophthora infestans T30-4]|uniref:Uncharacterized protein n=1 Tax=Phytophthora infestans (strain T30-4) TaxID=403677 RepID=D0N605_PHYIT|nr:uncharacterized protein PITG_05908 [Phytophthora infestans T30-4]EEY70496.1 conserved hypothetical protein [Phytophthora infestans T30-4]|eukprot:XP_002998150.1 conserved hypothetical protein [Phytophthora infestans T30-4]